MIGVLNVNKPSSFTSHDVVAVVRRLLQEKQIGHLGTLDPLATGVLPLAVGNATRLVEYASYPKEYRTVCLLGKTTDSCDITGKVLTEKSIEGLTAEQVQQAVLDLKSITEQKPPMVSAVKIGGQKLYEMARKGETIERTARPIQILEVEVLSIELPRVSFRVVCSPGTYVRVLCENIGETLGVGGCMEGLERTQVGPFSLANSISLDEIKKNVEAQNLSGMLLAPSLLVAHLAEIHLDESQLTALCLGQKLKSDRPELGIARVMNARGRLCAIVENMPEGILKPRKVFGIEGMV
ncbi:MAG TPA: tRNA pseudouridine(55) synthase TruB [bacterium]|jgi:tRNA pseudouridine55 synthase|nr:tRNA pseudouridine(55) synthase TruB [bacterium]